MGVMGMGTRYCPFCREVQVTRVRKDEIGDRTIRRVTVECIGCGRTLYVEVFPKKRIVIEEGA